MASQGRLIVALTPSGTAAATRRKLEELERPDSARGGEPRGPDANTHDAFRRVRGSYQWTMRIIDGSELAYRSRSTRRSAGSRSLTSKPWSRVCETALALWAVFFLVATGRGAGIDQVHPKSEKVLNGLDELSQTAPFGIKTTEAPHFHRVSGSAITRIPLGRRGGAPLRRLRSPRSVTDGNGFVFVDHRGEICPSGFLPLTLRQRAARLAGPRLPRARAVREAARDPDALEGKCGRCEFRGICGGSRTQAAEAAGSAFGSDPLCASQPEDGDS